MQSSKHLRSLTASVLAVGLLFGPVLPVGGQSDPTTFSGQATVLRSTTTVVGMPPVVVSVSDTGPLPSSGGSLETSLLTINVPGLATAEVAHATTIGQGNNSSSEASVADLKLTVAGNTVTADLLMANAEAKCSNGVPSATGSADILGLVVDGQAITVSGQPNQMIVLPGPAGSEIIINEQSPSVSGNTASITVNAQLCGQGAQCESAFPTHPPV
jgi:hypothetical protein